MKIGSRWKLRRGIDEWADSLAREQRYAGLVLEYEIRRCVEWYESKGKVPTMPDRAIRNWLERSAENLYAGQRTSPFPTGSEAAKPKDEPPRRSGSGRPSVDRVAEDNAQELKERSRIDEWEQKNREEAKIIWSEVWEGLECDRVIPERLKQSVARAVFRRRVAAVLDRPTEAGRVAPRKHLRSGNRQRPPEGDTLVREPESTDEAPAEILRFFERRRDARASG